MSNTPDIVDIITAAVAVAGLALSIYNFYVDRQDKKFKLLATMSYAVVGRGPQGAETVLALKLANPGQRTAFVSSCDLLILKTKKAFTYPDAYRGKQMPAELQPGQKEEFWFPLDKLETALRKEGLSGKIKVKARFRDAVGNEYLSKKFVLKI